MIKLNQSKILHYAKILKEEYPTGSGSKTKIPWSKFPCEKIYEKYVTPLLADLSQFDMGDFVDSKALRIQKSGSFEKLYRFLLFER